MASAAKKRALVAAKFRRVTATLLPEKARDTRVDAVQPLEQAKRLGQMTALVAKKPLSGAT